MNSILVNSTLGKVENLQEILPGEFAVVNAWREKGILAHLLLKEAGTGAVLIFNEADQVRVEQLISELPLSKYFEKTEYILLDKQF